MRRLTLFLLFVCISKIAASQGIQQDDIIGTWLTADKSGEITIVKRSNLYFGKITAGTGEQEYDIYNPDKARHNDPLIGLEILKNFVFDGDDTWKGGTVYDPKNGKTYSCQMRLLDDRTLKITGYIGFSWIGRSEEWTRLR